MLHTPRISILHIIHTQRSHLALLARKPVHVSAVLICLYGTSQDRAISRRPGTGHLNIKVRSNLGAFPKRFSKPVIDILSFCSIWSEILS